MSAYIVQLTVNLHEDGPKIGRKTLIRRIEMRQSKRSSELFIYFYPYTTSGNDFEAMSGTWA